jgi:hypothetical protein
MGDFVRFGVLFDDERKPGSFSGNLEFGLLGTVRIWARFNRSKRGGKDYWQLLALKTECPTLLGHEQRLAQMLPPDEKPDEDYWDSLLKQAERWEEPEEPETSPAQEDLWATTVPS